MLLDNPIVAFDIETIPDPEIGRRLFDMRGTDAEVIHEMTHRRLQETDGKTEYPQPPWHRIVAICASMLGPRTGRVEIRVCGSDLNDERSILEAFFALLKNEQHPPRLVSWNGSGFDLPIIRYRAMLHGIAAPGLYRSHGGFRYNNYQNRYHDMHVDLMDVLTGYGASSRVGLGNWCRSIGLPGKRFLDRQVYEHILAGELPRVIEHCKLDTVETLLAFLVLAHHRGELSAHDVRRHVDGVRASLDTFAYEGWREVSQSLVDWPHWAKANVAEPPCVVEGRTTSRRGPRGQSAQQPSEPKKARAGTTRATSIAATESSPTRPSDH